MSYVCVFGSEIDALLDDYLSSGHSFGSSLSRLKKPATKRELILGLFRTKKRLFFAESGDISIWNNTEQLLLGGLNIAVPVQIFDNGVWAPQYAQVHSPPQRGYLLFCPGPLLARRDCADYQYIVQNGQFVSEAYHSLLSMRLLPLLRYASATASPFSPATIMLPGIGCGMFAGRFRSLLSELFSKTITRMLKEHACALPNIRGVYFMSYNPDPSIQSKSSTKITEELVFYEYQNGPPLLCAPHVIDEKLRGTTLFKVVAWDHFSWPGNDFFCNARQTDDGVSAAATSVMAQLLPNDSGRYIYRYNEEHKCFFAYKNQEDKQMVLWQDVYTEKRLEPYNFMCFQ